MSETNYDVVVIGGGASGLFCAARAAEQGAKVLILEKNPELGKKLKITGGGRCNITNAEFDTKVFLEKFPQAAKFLHTPFAQFSAADTFEYFESRGLPLVVEARKRAFPHTHKAMDVYRVLEKEIRKHKVTTILHEPVIKLTKLDDGWLIKCKKTSYSCARVVLATGGVAAPETGSTGDGFKLLEQLGHSVNKPNPNIVPLTSDATWVHRLSGVTWSFMKLRFVQDGKTKIRKTGKILFTHFGISGPLVLNSSYEVKQLLHAGPVTAVIDLYPDTEMPDLDKRLVKLFDTHVKKQTQNLLLEMLPKKFVPEILQLANIPATSKAGEITKDQRKTLVQLLKNLEFEITGTLGFDKAVIADGGVALEEVDFKTMQSKLHSDLYILGDLLNLNRPSGGYSLQMCWTTGWVAGSHVAGQVAKA